MSNITPFRDQARPAVEIVLVQSGDGSGWQFEVAHFSKGQLKFTVQPTCEKPAFEDAFTADFVTAIMPYLPEEGAPQTILASSVWIELPELSLGKLRVIFATPSNNAAARMMLRFQKAVGDLQSILLPRFRADSSQRALMETTAAKALLDLLNPCLDLAEVDVCRLSPDQGRQVLERLIALKANKEELRIFAHLLQRLVARTVSPAHRSDPTDNLSVPEPVYPRYRPGCLDELPG